jgi:hypothetical protein
MDRREVFEALIAEEAKRKLREASARKFGGVFRGERLRLASKLSRYGFCRLQDLARYSRDIT